MDSPIKEIDLCMSPGHKITLSPAVLSNMVNQVPAEASTPSLGSSSSIASDSPCIPSLSGPGTPDMRQLMADDGSGWGADHQAHTENPLEIALDEDHSILLSPAEAHGPPSARPWSGGPLSALLSPREREWGDMVIRFPPVPGATPQLDAEPFPSQIQPGHKDNQSTGIFLPDTALHTLDRLTREVSPDEKSEASRLDRLRQEMKERSEPTSAGSRPHSYDGATPQSDSSFAKLSDYSFTQLSIPSPGGFFSSLQAGARHTWCINRSRTNSVPTSAIAENFYNPWEAAGRIQETVLDVAEDTNMTEGPPTVRQAAFDKSITEEPPRSDSTGSKEDQDLYGPGPAAATTKVRGQFEYEEAYTEEIKQAAEVNLDRTSNWLAAQTSYLSALRENNPVNDLEEPSTPHPSIHDDQPKSRTNSMDSNLQKTVRFLEEAKLNTSPVPVQTSVQTSPESEGADDSREQVFHTAFSHLINSQKKRDAFLHASARLEATRSDRIALPTRHMDNLLGKHSLSLPKRPKYSGPFNSNPRATGIFDRTPASLAFESAEREQRAVTSIQSSSWQVSALRSIYNGRLLASPAACNRLTIKPRVPLTDPACTGASRHRILDLGGDATASWAWHAALEWPKVKVYTVLTKSQASSQRPADEPKPAGPPNHRTVSVPHLWQLPFRSNHFDVISARSLHALLHHNPVPGVPSIDEWDLTLKECMRVLKPGGYLDFMVMDSGIARAGPKGEKTSVEFGFELHRRGYEREAARSWLRRLRKEGFVGVKRAWMFWPMGRNPEGGAGEEGTALDKEVYGVNGGSRRREFVAAPKPQRPGSGDSTISKIVGQYMDVDCVQGPVGRTEDVADLTGLVGSKMWEEWLVKVRGEAGVEAARLLDGVDEVLEEGKRLGSGWKVCIGWARKPRPKKENLDGQGVVEEAKGEIMVKLDEAEGLQLGSPLSEEGEVEMGRIPMMIQT